MHKISYTYTNKAKIILFLMLLAACALRLALVTEIHVFHIEGYEVYLLPTFLYYFVIGCVLAILFFGYKFFYTLYDDDTVSYHNLLLNRSRSIKLSEVQFALFSKKGISLYRSSVPDKKQKPDFFIPFFRLGIPDAVSTNNFFEELLDTGHIRVEKTFTVLPGYSKPWTLVSMLYAFITFCVLIICMQPLYTVIVLYQQFA